MSCLVNGRGPCVGDRVLDLSRAASRALGYEGTAEVVAEVLGRSVDGLGRAAALASRGVTPPDDARGRTRTSTGGPDRALEEQLSAGLDVDNQAASGLPDQGEFSVKVEDEDGGLVAGLTGWSWGTCAGISMVWVRPDARREGWGGHLLAAAEDVARARSCDRIFVSSFTFQAPAFYEQHGYAECARVPDYPLDGSADVYLRKYL